MKIGIKIILCLTLSLMLAFTVFPVFAFTPYNADLSLQSESVYFVNTDTGAVVYEKNSNEQICPASLVKIMTVILVLESADSSDLDAFLNQTVNAKSYIFDRLYGQNASNADIRPDEKLPMKDVLYATMLASACEGSMVLADFIDGKDTQAFVEKMNQKARELGMNNTIFVDPDGLDEKTQRSTAYDMYLLVDYCMKNPTFAKIVKSQDHIMSATNKHPQQRRIQHTNHMMSRYLGGKYYDDRVFGIKTGTANGIKNLISSATSGRYNYILVTMGAPESNTVNNTYVDASKLYNWAFGNLKFVTVGNPGEKMIPNNIKVNMGKDTDAVILTPKEQVIELLPKSINASAILWDTSKLPDKIDAPIEKGQIIGQVDLKLSGQVISTVDVVADQKVDLSLFAFISKLVKNIFMSWWFITIVIILGLVIILILIKRNINRKNKINRYKPFKRR